MNYFRYKLITASGEIDSGVAKLPYRETMSAVNHLERDGCMTLYVKKLGRLARWAFRMADLRPRRRMPRSLLAEILNNISLMLRAGMPLATALEETSHAEEFPAIAKDFEEIVDHIQGGSSFSEATQRYPRIFPKSVLYLIRMGEDTGRLDNMLKDAADHLKRLERIASDTKQALLYPAFVMVAIGGGMLFWFAYVVPKIVGLFRELDVTLPRLTQALIGLSEFVQRYFVLILLLLLSLTVLVVVLRKHSRKFHKAMDVVLLKLPVTKSIISASMLAYISEYFAMLINAGIDILQSIRILIESSGNLVYRDKLSEVLSSLELGEGIADSFKLAKIFPSFVVRMINVGETSGTMPDQLNYISEEYSNKLAIVVATIGKSIEPLILLVAGTIFAVIIIGLFLPIYDLVSRVSGL